VTLPSGTEPSDSDVLKRDAGLEFQLPAPDLAGRSDGWKYRDYTASRTTPTIFGPTAGLTVTLGKSGSIGLNMQAD